MLPEAALGGLAVQRASFEWIGPGGMRPSSLAMPRNRFHSTAARSTSTNKSMLIAALTIFAMVQRFSVPDISRNPQCTDSSVGVGLTNSSAYADGDPKDPNGALIKEPMAHINI